MKHSIFALLVLLTSCTKQIIEPPITIVQGECACAEPVPTTGELAAVPTIFAGSSSIYLWKGITTTFGIPVDTVRLPGLGIMDLYYRFSAKVTAKKPKQVGIYIGDNDFDRKDLTTAEIIRRGKLLVDKASKELPSSLIMFGSCKPNPDPNKAHYNPRIKEYNAVMKAYIQTKPNVVYADLYSLMVNPDGSINRTMYASDGSVHISAKGYEAWKKCFSQLMLKR